MIVDIVVGISILLPLKLFLRSDACPTRALHNARKSEFMGFGAWSTFSAQQKLYAVKFCFCNHCLVLALNPVTTTCYPLIPAIVKWVS
ncbi:MAG: hypothetical protein A2649_02805 [Candidatus Yanofskybacteria bacterium RIFCSPHIGHO2_01_FULL_41_26]|uniref:Uncharacterized protein n=1 Tax=Candidatus Yanofskybacteria bacterium RIFCSPHIGHO2_01_FULL_41_26 TaxID=1802661 RepID=A0A1F8EC33_9BACT|nr:MAG: hypothetical protein A2649_02805 [Candidatus Yanofskybacteria bacterium RIFCSPHIGHO2_01_FULL_41_26]